MKKTLIGETERPLICTPIVGKSRTEVLDELQTILIKNPDIIEWRCDYYSNIDKTEDVIALAKELKKMTGKIPVIFTIRSVREGGQATPLSEEEVIDLDAAVCRNTTVEYVDCELNNQPEGIRILRLAASEHGTRLIGSYHNFECTPDREILKQKFHEAKNAQFDVAKIATMPRDLEDVLNLLSVTKEAKESLKMPLITMSLGKFGVISRMIGGVFGSDITFAVGVKGSAPGQMPIEDVKIVLDIIEKYL